MEHVTSYYAASAVGERPYPPLAGAQDADVCVIGGGYTGISSALHLAERGYQVVLLEANRVGWGASGRNGGELFNGHRRAQEDLEAWFGREEARRLWDLSLEAVDLVTSRIQQHNIDCDLKPGVMQVAPKRRHVDYLRRMVDKLRGDYGHEAIRFLDRDETVQAIGTERYRGASLDSACYHLHPLNLAIGMARAAADAGARIFEQSRAVRYRSGDPAVVQTDTGEVRARFVVLACDGYLDNLEPRLAGRILPINNFMLATEPFTEGAARALIPADVSVSDTNFVVNYWRFSGDRRLLFGGGENYRIGFPADIRRFVRRFLLKVYPQLHGMRIDYGWGGRVAVTLKRMPDFGRLEANVFYAQGYSGQGIALGNLAGKLIAEAVSGTAERFDIMARLPAPPFPGGRWLRYPAAVLGMLYYAMLDRL